MSQIILTGTEARQKLINGINKLSSLVTTTLGPSGRNVIYTDEYGSSLSTKDGVTVAKRVKELKDPIENLGIQMLKQAAIKTADLAGDGTTTSTLLASEMVNKGLKYINNGANAVELKKGIEAAVKQVIEYLRKSISEDISNENQLEQIATISANNDIEIGKLIAEAIKKVGREGVVHIEESKTGETYLETVEGIQFNRGYKSHFFVTDNSTMTCVLNDVVILIVDKRISKIEELLPLLNRVSSENKSLLIIAEDVEGTALATLIVNKMRETIKVAAVKAPDYGDRRKLLLEDIAILTGGQVISSEKGMKLDKIDPAWLGQARVVSITKDQTTIVDGNGDINKIKARIEELKSQIDKSVVPYEKEQLQNRLAKCVNGVSIIHVGGNTETEIKEKKDRVDDALHAAKSSLEEGILPGGGVALLYAREAIKHSKTFKWNEDFIIGTKIIYESLSSPFYKILYNSGKTEQQISLVCFNLINEKNIWVGYNLKEEEIVNMKSAGILDPTLVVITALKNAASVASLILLTEGCIVDEKEEKKESVESMNY